MKRRLKINGIIIFCAFLLVAIFPAIFFRKEKIESLDEIAEVFGIAFILLGQIFRISARGYKSECSHNGHSLVKGGPYALVRNPMYLGIILTGLGVILMLFEWWAMLIFFVFFTVRYILLVFKEEKALLRMFPSEYPSYQRCVPSIVPSMNDLLQKDIKEYLPLKLSWIKKEIGSIIGVLFLALFLESREDIQSQGFIVYLKEAKFMGVVILLFLAVGIYLTKHATDPSKNAAVKSKDNS